MRHIIFITCLVLVGCGGTPYKDTSYKASSNAHNSSTSTNSHSNTARSSLNKRSVAKARLQQHYNEWRGTRYQYGGLSRRGVDCSGFVYLTYRSRFGIDLPRSTQLQSSVGMPVSQRQLVVGDLVFFRTGHAKRHVGIYMGNRRFMHASTSKGVTISSMDNVYWRNKYWKAQRI